MQHYLRCFVILKLRAVKAEKVVEVNSKEWRKRFKYRMDLSSRLTHLTKGVDKDDAFNNLINILEEKRLKGVARKKDLYVEKYQQFVYKMLRFLLLLKICNMKKC